MLAFRSCRQLQTFAGRACLGLVLLFGASACAAETPEPVGSAPGAFLLDHRWEYRTAQFVVDTGDALPFPTDQEIVASVEDSDSVDALQGSRLNFGADGRVLVEPLGLEEFQDLGSRYSVVDARTLRLRLGPSLWFPYEYHFDVASGALLLNPEPMAAEAVAGLVNDVLNQVLLAGSSEIAGKLVDALFDDPRVAAAMSSGLAAALDAEPDAAARWLAGLLAPSEILDPALSEAALQERLLAVVDALAETEPEELPEELIEATLEAGVVDPSLASERAEKALCLAQYRRALATSGSFAAVARVEIELDRTD